MDIVPLEWFRMYCSDVFGPAVNPDPVDTVASAMHAAKISAVAEVTSDPAVMGLEV